MSLQEEIASMVTVERTDHRDHSKVYAYQAINDASIMAIIKTVLNAAIAAHEKADWYVKADKYLAIKNLETLKEGLGD